MQCPVGEYRHLRMAGGRAGFDGCTEGSLEENRKRKISHLFY